ncbi:MAG: hypothetical protein FWC29_04685 [Methanomassiliicoccaceae archaeon]|nr:hypothetical protein [Methanomassiliicoccaceae archaeon]
MVKVDPSLWMVLNVVGMALLVVGALSIMLITPPESTISAVFMAAGIILIVVSAVFVGIDGHKLRKEDEEFRRFEAIRDEARRVPDDLKEGYVIDYTAEDPDKAISYRSNKPELHRDEFSDDNYDDSDVVIIYSN